MLEFAHAFTGGIIAYKVGNPLISLPLALISHFAVDLLPHWNPHLSEEKKKYGKIPKKTLAIIIADCLFGLFIGLYLAKLSLPDVGKAATVLLGCFLGILPDLVEAPYFFMNVKNKYLKMLLKFQSKLQWNVPFVYGMLSQGIYFFLLLSLIKN